MDKYSTFYYFFSSAATDMLSARRYCNATHTTRVAQQKYGEEIEEYIPDLFTPELMCAGEERVASHVNFTV